MNVKKESENYKRGFLKNDFEFFHIKDQRSLEFEFHYHDFNKIIIFISGKVTYLIEGKAYNLKPWDILLVNSNEVHRPVIDPAETYERIVLWINSTFLEKHSSPECNLLTCFGVSSDRNYKLLRLNPDLLGNMKYILTQLEDACKSKSFGARLLKNALFVQFIVYANRFVLQTENSMESHADVQFDEQISSVINYINDNLSGDLTIENLAARFFTSRYYLMHKFKSQTGYSIHSYILKKRLIMSNSLIKKGKSVTEAALECGFNDYSNYLRAFTAMFGLSPKKYHKAVTELQNQLTALPHVVIPDE